MTQLSAPDIYDYLRNNENLFVPPLSVRLDLKSYSKKLHKYAVHFCAFDYNRLVGLIACYFNDLTKKTAFISSVSVVKEFQEMGVFSALFSLVRNYGVLNQFNNLQLEVNSENQNAIKIYKKIGFEDIDHKNQIVTMELKIGDRGKC